MASIGERVQKAMSHPTRIRNIAICAHIDHGKTTFSDNLLAGAGMLSEHLAGQQRALDFNADEQARGITIDAANVSMLHTFDEDDQEYLVNLIDTPGHVDFGGDVTRAMRAVDGAIVLSCAVEGIMPQTETVLRQALKERDKPILFINKVDRLIKEVKLTPEEMQKRFVTIISKVNKMIRSITNEEKPWQVSVADGSVCFGSAFHNWALSVPYMQKHNLGFKDIIAAYENDEHKELAKKAPLHTVILNAVIRHLPDPVVAQKYRIPRIWHGDVETPAGKSIQTCDPKGPIAFVVTKTVIDKHAGEVCAGRLFSGTVKKGDQVYIAGTKKMVRIQQVNVYKGAQRIQVDEALAGNIVGLVGLGDGGRPGQTIVGTQDIEPFEAITHIFEPVVTKSIEATRPSDLPKLIEVLRQLDKEDPSLHITINEETGENLLSGMGELHLEVIEGRIKTEKGLDVKLGNPIVVYREGVLRKTPEPYEGKSPNKHNKLYFTVEPVEEQFSEAIKKGDVPSGRIKRKDKSAVEALMGAGYDRDEAQKVRDIYNGNVFVDATRGIVQINEIMEMVLDMFEEVCRQGPLAREPCLGIKVTLHDCKLHEDAIHRGPGQMYPAVRDGIRGAMTSATTVLYEPLQIIQFVAPATYMGELSKLISNKRGQLLDMEQEGEEATVSGKMPVGEMFGLSNDLRSATGGRGTQFVVDQVFDRLPGELQPDVLSRIRQRKGLGDNE